jgi:hypothetical protein
MPVSRFFRIAAALLLASGTPARALDVAWTNTAGGAWSAATNWNPNHTPTTNDAAFITNAGVYTVTLDASNITVTNLILGGPGGQQTLATTNFSLTFCSTNFSQVNTNGIFLLQGGVLSGDLNINGLLDWTGGQLGDGPVALTVTTNGTVMLDGANGTNYTLGEYVTNSGTIVVQSGNFFLALSARVNSNGAFLLEGGTFSGELTIDGQLTWTGGELGSNTPAMVTVTTNGSITLAGLDGSDYTLGESVTNSGTIRLESGNLFVAWCENDGQINNSAQGLVDMQADVSIDGDGCNGSGLANQGIVRKSGGTGTTGINVNLSNSGTLDVQTGAVVINAIGNTDEIGSGSGLFEAEAGATLVFSNDFSMSGTVSGAGTTVIGAGTVTLTGGLDTSNTVLAGGTLMGVNGMMSGLITWTNGVLGNAFGGITLETNGVLLLTGVDGVDYSVGEYFTNAGTILLQSGNLQLNWDDYGELINLPGGLVELASDVSIDDLDGSPGLFNYGTVRKSHGTGVSSIDPAFNNTGTLDVQTGTVELTNMLDSLTGGTLNFGINSLTNFGQVILGGSPAALDGAVSINLNNGYVPGVGSSFPVVLYETESGEFTNATWPSEVVCQTNYGANAFSFVIVESSRPPLLTTPQWLGGGRFQFSFGAANDVVYSVQYSTNLPEWKLLEQVSGNGSTLTFIDTNATDKARCYRVISP